METEADAGDQTGADPVSSLPCNEWLTAGIWRVDAGNRSVIHKRYERPLPGDPQTWDGHWSAASADPRHWSYWMREPLLLSSRLPLDIATERFRLPEIYEVVISEESADVWMEDLAILNLPGPGWRRHDYVAAAHDLGTAQGMLAHRLSELDQPWLCAGYLRDYSADKPFSATLLDEETAWEGPLVKPYVDDRLKWRLQHLMHSVDRLLVLCDGLPKTLCHNDFWTRNLFAAGNGPGTTAIDWAFTGFGPVGADVANLLLSGPLDGFFEASALPAIEVDVVQAYTSALTACAPDIDPHLIRVGVHAAGVKYSWLCAALLQGAHEPGTPTYCGYGGGDAHHRFSEAWGVLDHVCGWAEDALSFPA